MNCKYCHQKLPENFKEYKKQIHGEKMREVANRKKVSGEHFGCPKKYEKKQFTELREKGLSYRKIAKELGCSTETVQNYLKRYQ